MAALNAVAEVLENLDADSEDLHIILVPKCLGLLLKLDGPAKIRENGYKTEKGTELSEEFVNYMCAINELREWLGTNVVRFKIQGSQLLYKNELEMISNCWKITDTVLKATKTNRFTGRNRGKAGDRVRKPAGLRPRPSLQGYNTTSHIETNTVKDLVEVETTNEEVQQFV